MTEQTQLASCWQESLILAILTPVQPFGLVPDPAIAWQTICHQDAGVLTVILWPAISALLFKSLSFSCPCGC